MYLAAPAGGSNRNDAIAGAAATVLRYLYPDEAMRVDAQARELADPGSRAFALGRVIGRVLIARAESDGSDAVWTGSPPTGPGYWVPTPPGFLPPLEPLAGTWKPWNLQSGGQFRPGPAPAYGSPQFLAELDEVYRVSTSLTAEQKRIADFWSDGAGTVTPPGHWSMIALNLIRDENWSALHSTRLLAALNTAQADAFIACWDAVSLVRLRSLHHVRCSLDRARCLLSRPGRRARRLGRGGGGLAPLWRHPLRERQRNRARAGPPRRDGRGPGVPLRPLSAD